MTSLRLLWFVLAVPAVGLAVLELLDCRPRERLAALGLGTATGAATLVLALTAPLMIDGHLSLLPALGLALLGSLLQLPRPGRLLRMRVRPVHVALLLGLVLLVQAVSEAPMRGYDAKAIYGLKAKALQHEGHVLGPVFQDPEVVHYHGDYPLGVPLLMAACALVAEGPADDPAGVRPATDAVAWSARHDGVELYVPAAALWAVALVALVGAAARRRMLHDLQWLMLLAAALPATLVAPFAAGRSWTWAGADLPLVALLTAIAWVARELFQVASRGRCVLLALLVVGAVLVKNDAQLALLSMGAATVLAGPRRGRRRVALSIAAGALVGLAIVARVRGFGLAAPYDEQWLPALLAATPASLAARLPVLLAGIVPALVERGLALHFGFLVVLVLPLGFARRGVPRWLALFTTLHLLGSTALFLVTPDVLPWHLSTALPRLWAHAAGPAALLVVDVLASLWAHPRTHAGALADPHPRALAPQLPPPR